MKIVDSAANGNRRKTLTRSLSALFGLGLLIFFGARTGFGEFLSRFREINPEILVPLVVVYSISWIFRGLRLKEVLLLSGVKTGLFHAAAIELLADLPNQIIPARLGDSLKVVYMHRKGMLDYKQGAFAAVLVRSMDLAAVVFLALFSVIFISRAVAADHLSYIVTIAVLLILLGLSGWLFVFQTPVFQKMLAGPLKKLRPAAEEMAGQIRRDPGRMFAIFAVSMMIWIFDILTLLIFLTALGVRLSFAETAFVLLLSTVAKIIPLTPNGLGIYEGMMIVILSGFGVPESTAFTVAVLDHGFMNIYSLLLSVISVYSLGLGLSGTRKLFQKREVTN
jgi:uncharacterized protein (TIRG00374 family)